MYSWNMCCWLSSESASTLCRHLPSRDCSTTPPAVSSKSPGHTAHCHHTTSLRWNRSCSLSSEMVYTLCRHLSSEDCSQSPIHPPIYQPTLQWCPAYHLHTQFTVHHTTALRQDRCCWLSSKSAGTLCRHLSNEDCSTVVPSGVRQITTGDSRLPITQAASATKNITDNVPRIQPNSGRHLGPTSSSVATEQKSSGFKTEPSQKVMGHSHYDEKYQLQSNEASYIYLNARIRLESDSDSNHRAFQQSTQVQHDGQIESLWECNMGGGS